MLSLGLAGGNCLKRSVFRLRPLPIWGEVRGERRFASITHAAHSGIENQGKSAQEVKPLPANVKPAVVIIELTVASRCMHGAAKAEGIDNSAEQLAPQRMAR